MVSIHSNESFWNGCEIFTRTSLVNTQNSDLELPGNMATNVINFKVGFTKAKSRQRLHQIGILQQLNVQHAKQGKSEGFDSCDRPSNLKLDSNRQFFHPCDREIWWMTLKNNRALLLYYVKLCASFQIHWWIQTGFTVQKHSIRVQIGDMLSRVTLKSDGWPWKTIEHLFYATSSFLHHFVAIGEFKLELQSGNAQSGSNSTNF